MSNGFKDKDQSIFEFYETLQKEYVVCELRRRIYPREKDKRYYSKTASFKKAKIEDISLRNQLPSIFTDESVRSSINEMVYGKIGFPNFSYKNEAERKELESKDMYYYYRTGVEVRVMVDDEIRIGVVTEGIVGDWDFVDGSDFKQLVISKSDTVVVKLRGESEERTVLLDQVSRIV